MWLVRQYKLVGKYACYRLSHEFFQLFDTQGKCTNFYVLCSCIQFNKLFSGCPFPQKKEMAFEMDPEGQVEMKETPPAEAEQHEKRSEWSMYM